MTNLEKLIKGIGWQGGTIFQVSEELIFKGMSKELCKVDNLLKMNQNGIDLILSIYKAKG